MRGPHTVPVIERMMELLGELERERDGLGIGELVARCGIARSTVYRIVNSLEAHGMVRREESGRYRLGARVLRLASRMPEDPRTAAIVAVAMPFLRTLSRDLGETSKISVRDGTMALAVAGVQGQGETTLALTIGKHYPLHAGAASKVLLAALPTTVREAVLAAGLAAHTEQTISDRVLLEQELEAIRRQGWAEDRAEYLPNVGALAAPIRWDGEVAAAVSVAFLADAAAARKAAIQAAVVAAAAAISAALQVGGGPPQAISG